MPWQREQLITGICSDACWQKHLGHGAWLKWFTYADDIWVVALMQN
jgi:hypothetical protein